MSNDKRKVVSRGYEYFMIFPCMLAQAVPYGIAQLIQPLFIHPLVNTFHFTLASYILIFIFGAAVGSLVLPLVDKALREINLKILYLIDICLSVEAYVIFGIGTKPPSFYLAGAICMVGSTFYSGQGVPWVINHWFPFKGRDVTSGLAFCGGSIGDIFLQPITQEILKHFMTDNTKTGHLTSITPFFVFAVTLLVIGLIVMAFIRVPRKDEILASVQEIEQNQHEAAQRQTCEFQGQGGKQAPHMEWLWISSIRSLITGLGLTSLNKDYAAFLDAKLSLTEVGIIGSVFGFAGVIGSISGGYLSDKFGTAKSAAYAGIMLIIAILMMIFISLHPCGDRINFYAGMDWAFTSGLSVFSYMSGPAFMSKSLFGAKAQGINLGCIGLAYTVGLAVGAPLPGVIKSATSFTTAWYYTTFFVAIGFILLTFAAIKIKRMQKNIAVNKPNAILDK